MRIYWDSGALLNALAGSSVSARFEKGEHVTRSHAYIEAFHHLSGQGLPLKDGTRQRVTPSDAARMIRKLSSRLEVRDMKLEETLQALDDAQRAGVMGRNVHDWIHTRTAKLAGCNLVLTRDDDFMSSCEHQEITTDWP